MKRRGLTRREALMLLGMGSAAAAGTAAGVLAVQSTTIEPRVVIVPADPTPVAASVQPPPIVSRAEWGALPPNHNARNERGFYSAVNPFGWRRYEGNYRDIYRTLVVHHSVIYNMDDVTTLRDVQTLHTGDRAWADVGYHFLIGKDGRIYEGRDLAVRGTHVGGYNTGSAGVCLLGDFRQEQPTSAQWDSLNTLGRWLTHELPLTHLAAHQDFNPDTVCPGPQLLALLDDLALAFGLNRGTEGYEQPVAFGMFTDCPCGCHNFL